MTTLELLLVGGPTTLLRYGGLTVLTDPTFDEPRSYPGSPLTKLTGPALSIDQVGPVDLVLLSHDQHSDNLDVTGAALLSTVPLTLSTPLAAERLPGVRGLSDGEQVRVGDVTVTAVPARHGPPGIEAVAGPVTGFVLSSPGRPTVYVSGDNAAIEHVASLAEQFEVDVAVLHVGAARIDARSPHPLTLTARGAVHAARLLPGAVVVPVHAEGWAHFSEGTDEVVAAFDEARLTHRLRVVAKGERAVLGAVSLVR